MRHGNCLQFQLYLTWNFSLVFGSLHALYLCVWQWTTVFQFMSPSSKLQSSLWTSSRDYQITQINFRIAIKLVFLFCLCVLHACVYCYLISGVTHLFGKSGNVREFDSCHGNIRELSGRNFVRAICLLLVCMTWVTATLGEVLHRVREMSQCLDTVHLSVA